jgi:hypothetical protein
VIPFIQSTWFVWWILATLFILRWFHLFSSRTGESALEAADSREEETAPASNQIPPGAEKRIEAEGVSAIGKAA